MKIEDLATAPLAAVKQETTDSGLQSAIKKEIHRRQATHVVDRTEDSQRTVEFITAADVPPVKLEWLWYARLARGAITLLEGAPENGKSTLLLDLAARVSYGDSFPGEQTTREPGDVVMMIAEDDLATTVVPRLMAAGADLTRIHFLSITRDEHGDPVPFHLSDDSKRLLAKCQDVNAVLVVVDPLVSFLGSRRGHTVNTGNDMEVRKALGPLKDLAEHTRAAVVAIRHYRKGTAANAMEAGGGSVAFAALVRVILAALPDPEEDRYLLAVAKNNLVQKQKRPAFAYTIVPWECDEDIGRIAWGEVVNMSANEILIAQAEADKGGKKAEAQAFLEARLAEGDWVPSAEIFKDALEGHGLSDKALRRAKETMPIQVEKHGAKWFWRLVNC